MRRPESQGPSSRFGRHGNTALYAFFVSLSEEGNPVLPHWAACVAALSEGVHFPEMTWNHQAVGYFVYQVWWQ